MKSSNILSSVLVAAVCLLEVVYAQTTTEIYTDADTGISFGTTVVSTAETEGGFTVGFALPPSAATTNYYDYIGIMVGAINNGTGWSGISHGGGMPDSLLLMAWAYNGDILHSFRYATGYVTPDLYTGNATLTPISKSINDTHWQLIYLCSNCFEWDQDDSTGSTSTSGGTLVIGWAQAFPLPSPASSTAGAIVEHDNGFDIFGYPVASATFSSYSAWATQTITSTSATGSATPTPTSSTSASATATSSYSSQPVPTSTYDYIVVGGGAGGVPVADALSAAGHSVLLIERGPPSSGRYNGTMKPAWLDGTNLTRFDVPGLCNEIWVDSANVACPDTDQMAGCVLGGGTAVNAGLWWKPNTVDWDVNFPKGWQSSDMSAATTSVFNRIPGTDHPSMDGQLYYQQGFDVITSGLAAAGWTDLAGTNGINASPNEKNRTYGHTEYMFINGERGGPLATYLVSASARSNFKMWTNTTVDKVIRTAGHITGVQVEAFGDGGYKGVINVTATTGRVILSAGVFGTSKILFRSGIGPTDQLTVVSGSTDGPTMINSNQWIDLPVGENLDDHTNTDTLVSHPNVTFYDFYAAWNNPNATDASMYLNHRTGILAQAAPNIGPMMFDEITGADGVVRQLEWTSRVESNTGTDSAGDNHTMTMSQYLGRGATSRGRLTIKADLTTTVSTVPYLHDQNDIDAVIQGIENLQNALSSIPDLTWIAPDANTSATDYVNNMLVATSNRRANHWIGTAKIGTDDGRTNNGTAVVDLNTKVYGTDNLFVVDAGIFPGEPSTNPSAYIVIASQKAASNILALAAPSVVARYQQCGGIAWTGSSVCAAGTVCTWQNAEYFQCL